jgi:hypothetical protein
LHASHSLARSSSEGTKTCHIQQVLCCGAGGISSSEPLINPISWLSDKSWGELVHLSADVKGFDGLEQAIRADPGAFKVRFERQAIPATMSRCLRP